MVLKKEESWYPTAPSPRAEYLGIESLNIMLAVTTLHLSCLLFCSSAVNPENSVHAVTPCLLPSSHLQQLPKVGRWRGSTEALSQKSELAFSFGKLISGLKVRGISALCPGGQKQEKNIY